MHRKDSRPVKRHRWHYTYWQDTRDRLTGSSPSRLLIALQQPSTAPIYTECLCNRGATGRGMILHEEIGSVYGIKMLAALQFSESKFVKDKGFRECNVSIWGRLKILLILLKQTFRSIHYFEETYQRRNHDHSVLAFLE